MNHDYYHENNVSQNALINLFFPRESVIFSLFYERLMQLSKTIQRKNPIDFTPLLDIPEIIRN